MYSVISKKKFASAVQLIKDSIRGGNEDFTKGSIRRAVLMLAIPMILEMCLESVFAVVDIFFVGKLGKDAAATVGLTESVLMILYSMAMGLSMAATAMVARRVGEKNLDGAAKAAMQAIIVALIITLILSITGVVFAKDILGLMGAPQSVIAIGVPYARLMFGGCVVIILLFLINGIFRGAGDASIAMRSLWIANIINIILCPVLIYGFGPIPGFGLLGAALATTIGRGSGVLYQLYHLLGHKGLLQIKAHHFVPNVQIIGSIFKVAITATGQFLIASASWIFLSRIIASFGSDAIAGYTIALRIIGFFILPAWGLSNAAATLVGQNLGANQPDRAEKSVWMTGKYNTIFMVCVTIFFFFGAETVVRLINQQQEVVSIAIQALRIISLGYISYGIGMVLINAFNGAGDTKTPTLINFFGFWCFQIPLGYVLAYKFNAGPQGVFFAILIAETFITVATFLVFRRGKWKKVQI